MTTTPNLGVTYIDSGIPQPEVTHNDGMRVLDALVQLIVLDRDLAAPPGSPSDGQRWIVAASPTGTWTGHTNHVLAWQDGAWRVYVPQVGWLAYVVDEGLLAVWTGSAWIDVMAAPTALQNLALLGLGTTADSSNPFSAKLNNAMWVAKTVAEGGDGNLRYKLSKESAAKTLSFLMQTNFSGRAEFGLTGDDDFHFKVSPDGSSWSEALTISRANGGVRFLAAETDVASGATCDIGAAASLKVRITGTTTLTSFGTAPHTVRIVRFAGAVTLTHNATSLILPGGANIVTAAGDTCLALSDASGNWRVLAYQRANGHPLTTGNATIASAGTTDLGSVIGDTITVSGTTTITSFGTTAPVGARKLVTFSGALTLTHNATSLILPGASSAATASGDCLIAVHEGAGNWRIENYARTNGLGVNAAVASPLGRLTLTSGTQITTSDVVGATSVYYTPAIGCYIPIYNGSYFVHTPFSELTLALDNSSGHTGYQQSGKNFDLFVINDGGTIRLGTGPAWSSDTTRGTGAGTTELQLLNGLQTNKNTMTLRFGSASGNTVSVAANQATYVGSIRATADGVTEDSAVKRFCWNAYNQTLRVMKRQEAAGGTWAYSTASWRQANANAANQLDFLTGLAGVPVQASLSVPIINSTSTLRTVFGGIGLDSTSAQSASISKGANAGNNADWAMAVYDDYPGIGRHFLSWNEYGAGTDTQTWLASAVSGAYQSGLVGKLLG